MHVPPLPDLHHFQQTEDSTGSGSNDNLAVDVRNASAMTTENSGASDSFTVAKNKANQKDSVYKLHEQMYLSKDEKWT